MASFSPKLGVLAGSGPLPGRIIAACQAQGRAVFVVAFEGETAPETCAGVAHVWLRLGAVGALLRALKKEHCRDVVLAGPVRRPSMSSLKPDLRALKLLGKIGRSLSRGDDVMLTVVVEELEAEGFRVVGADDLLDGLVAPTGVLGAQAPDDGARRDIALGVHTARALGALDIGQAVVVQQGVVLGVEAAEGTDGLIARCGALQDDGPGGVLVKLKKPDQERRADLPTVGAGTIEAAAEAGLRGIAVEAGETLMFDRAELIAAADRLGLFVVGLDAP